MSLNNLGNGLKLSSGRQFEVGIKQQLARNLGEWTLAAYHIKKRDIITSDPDNPTISIQGGGQSARGVEAGATLNATRALRFSGNVAYTRARFDDLHQNVGGVLTDMTGNRPANVAPVTANLWGHYRHGPWRAGLGLSYVGARFADNANTARMPSYTLLNAVLSWEPNPRVTLSLIGRNLTNRFYARSAYGSQWLIGDGLSYELRLLMRF